MGKDQLKTAEEIAKEINEIVAFVNEKIDTYQKDEQTNVLMTIEVILLQRRLLLIECVGALEVMKQSLFMTESEKEE